MRFSFIALLVIVADQLTKWWVVQTFALFESREVIAGFFNLTYLTNNGAAFSMLAGQPALWRQTFFIVAASLALVVIVIAKRSYGRVNPLYDIALALIAGGAIGNLIDRIRLGSVVDFFDVYIGTHHWPTFNVADSAITVGVTLFLITNIVVEAREKKGRRLQQS